VLVKLTTDRCYKLIWALKLEIVGRGPTRINNKNTYIIL
jgi:hypothetical protein